MSLNTTNIDPEEDAADLQFPKVPYQSTDMVSNIKFDYRTSSQFYFRENLYCVSCSSTLVAPYILCDECNLNICCICFSNGAEFLKHKNDHNYRVLYDDFYLFEYSNWTAREEETLLDSILKYNNWEMVARQLPNRSFKEIIEHYDYFYLQRKGSNLFPKLKEREAAVFPEPVVPYMMRITNSEEPPRYHSNNIGYNSLAGYNAARSDFEIEYDRSAEDLLAKLQDIDPDHPHYEVLSNLQCAIVRIYNRRLQQRLRRKRIMRNHGLISYRKVSAWLHRYDITITKNVCNRLQKFMQFYSGEKFEFVMEGLHRSGELKYKIFRLMALRSKGITTLEEARLYNHLEQIHENNKKSLKVFKSDPRLSIRKAGHRPGIAAVIPPKRRSGYTPIDIVGMPGYDKLHTKERELCKAVRLVPASYLEFKEILVSENKKNGYVSLQTARKLLRIDVNKTRKLFDFLIEEGYIDKK